MIGDTFHRSSSCSDIINRQRAKQLTKPEAIAPLLPNPDDFQMVEIDKPSYYKGSNFEVIDIIEDFNLGFRLGNAIKYILRCGKKGKREDDLKKAIWYLEREVNSA